MGWNYRVMRVADRLPGQLEEVCYQIHEVHYGVGGAVRNWTQREAGAVSDTRDGLLEVLAMMTEALAQPVLDSITGEEIEPQRILSDDLRTVLRASADYFEHPDGKFSRVKPAESGATTPLFNPKT
jgi:hypothetical protein